MEQQIATDYETCAFLECISAGTGVQLLIVMHYELLVCTTILRITRKSTVFTIRTIEFKGDDRGYQPVRMFTAW